VNNQPCPCHAPASLLLQGDISHPSINAVQVVPPLTMNAVQVVPPLPPSYKHTHSQQYSALTTITTTTTRTGIQCQCQPHTDERRGPVRPSINQQRATSSLLHRPSSSITTTRPRTHPITHCHAMPYTRYRPIQTLAATTYIPFCCHRCCVCCTCICASLVQCSAVLRCTVLYCPFPLPSQRTKPP
jgi:hypothetical protein